MIAKHKPSIDALIASEDWPHARLRIQAELKRDPRNHWLQTQYGVTLYEERRYAQALKAFLKSLPLQPDCPLTLWNLAGCFDALGRHHDALRIYSLLVQAKPDPKSESCWESKTWANSLQADCLFRIGICYVNLKQDNNAREFFESYLHLLANGIRGTYSQKDVAAELRKLGKLATPQLLNRRIKSILRSETARQTSGLAELDAIQ